MRRLACPNSRSLKGPSQTGTPSTNTCQRSLKPASAGAEKKRSNGSKPKPCRRVPSMAEIVQLARSCQPLPLQSKRLYFPPEAPVAVSIVPPTPFSASKTRLGRVPLSSRAMLPNQKSARGSPLVVFLSSTRSGSRQWLPIATRLTSNQLSCPSVGSSWL